jgi:hypothetical protein
MASRKFCSFLLGAVIAAGTWPVLAQQAPPAPEIDSSAEAAASASAAATAEATATAALIAKANAAATKEAAAAQTDKTEDRAFTKKAVAAGWRPEVHHGVTLYCRLQSEVGTRFTKKICGTQLQLEVVMEQQEFARDQLKQRGCGGNCGN